MMIPIASLDTWHGKFRIKLFQKGSYLRLIVSNRNSACRYPSQLGDLHFTIHNMNSIHENRLLTNYARQCHQLAESNWARENWHINLDSVRAPVHIR